MAAFAQFGSDLDPASQRLLHRGERLTEMLKQNQYEPLPIEREVLIIFAANEGYFDKLQVNEVKPFERDLFGFFASKHSDLLDEIKNKREITDDLRKRLIAAIDEFQKTRSS
jgi:F-type H+-transporting ATPase subunit alpha